MKFSKLNWVKSIENKLEHPSNIDSILISKGIYVFGSKNPYKNEYWYNIQAKEVTD